ncbi:MAG: AAA family ATPase [Anaerolineae bacterium]|nr:AAA family ATPase [Anaerolineae bacterium]
MLLESELGAEPEAETTALYEQIRERRLSPPRASGLFARVQPDADYVEPADDIELAQRMLNTPNCRLLTVYGISGIGKTMLATQLAFHRQHLYRDGARFVSLVSAQSARDLLEAAARALEVGFASSMTEAAVERAVIEALKPQHMLLVLDNYEQLLPETGFIQRVLLEAPSVQVFITSQSPLNLFREWLLPLKGLRVPEIGAANPETYEAVRLFDLTARRVNPRFDLDSALDDVIRICQMVDSLPLGIVIAAGWVQFMPPGAILQMMQKDLMRMEAVHQDMPTRHQTFQGLLNAMLAHLTPQEQETMMALSVFEGTFDFRAALVVAGVSPKRFKDLTDRALIQQAGEFRYCMHNFLRQAFFPQLAHSPLLRSVALRYVAHFQAWSEEFLAQNLPLHELMLVLDGEAHNLWQVPGLTDEERQRFLMHIAPAMTEYWVNRGYQARGIIPLLQAGGWNREITPAVRVRGLVALARILERTSQYDPSWDAAEEALRLEAGLNLPESRARALRVLSEICARQGKYDRAVEMLQAIIAMEAQIGSGGDARIERLISLAYEDLGEILVSQSQYDVARQTLDIAIRRWNRQGEILRESVARSYLGIIALKQGENADAFDLFTNILARAREAGNQTLIAVFAAYLGAAAMRLGDVRFAGATLRAALEIAVNIDRRTSIIHLCELFTELSLLLDRPEAGAQLFGFAAAQRERLNLPVSPHNRSEYQARQAALRSRLGDGYGWHDQSGRSAGLTAVVQLADLLADAAADAGPAR